MDLLVSIIIVNYNSGKLLEECVASILRSVRISCEVLIVDNASTDDSLAFLENEGYASPAIILIRNQKNEGFAAANNRGAAEARGQWLHFLNPDTMVHSSLDIAYRTLSEQDHDGIWVTPLQDTDGVLVKSWYFLPTVANYFRAILRPLSGKRWYLGASVLMTSAVFERLGRWSTDYFLYSEDLDLFYKAALLNIPTRRLNTVITHVAKGTTRHLWSTRRRSVIVESSYFKFCRKYGLVKDYYLISFFTIFRKIFSDPRDALLRVYSFLTVQRKLLIPGEDGPWDSVNRR
jgi:GT2 family glycosyltransferase